MNKLIALAIALLGLQLTVANGQTGSAAVVDLDKVAKELGVIAHINHTLVSQTAAMRQELVATQNEFRVELEKAKANLGDKPSDQQKWQLMTKSSELQTKFQLEEQKKQQAFQISRQKLIDEFRQQLRPLSLKIAKEKGFDVVLNTTMPPVYAFQESADITKEVTAAAKASGLTRTISTSSTTQKN